jgi:hypothetical protein
MIAYHRYLSMVVPNAYWQKKYLSRWQYTNNQVTEAYFTVTGWQKF